jgi:hypothetical protein
MLIQSMHIIRKICKNKYINLFLFKLSNSQIGTNVRIRVFNAGLLARSQFASGRSCNRPTRSKFSVVFLGPRAKAQLVPKFTRSPPNVIQKLIPIICISSTRRTSGRCLGTFKTVSCPPPPQNVVSLTISPLSFSLSLGF